LKDINAKIIKLTKRKTELLERKDYLKELSYQKQTNIISDQTNWTRTGILYYLAYNCLFFSFC